MSNITLIIIGAILWFWAFPCQVHAQSQIYDISWNTISSGSSWSQQSGFYNLGYSIAQPIASNSLATSGNIYLQSIGFWFARYPGDTNGDGCVNDSDLLTVLFNFGGTGLGDTNLDGIIDDTDLLSVLINYGNGC